MEHYDKSLFALLAPFLAPLFFPNIDPLVALLLIYLPLGVIARPLGALFWSRLENRLGKKRILYFTLMGSSITVLLTGFLPSYQTAGITSTLLLHITRGLICFFAAGEGTGASLILIENTPKESRNLMSSYYEMSSMLGTLLAALLITGLCFMGTILVYWRVLFIFSGLLGLAGFWLRKDTYTSLKNPPKKRDSVYKMIKKNKISFFLILVITGFLYANYNIATYLMNGYIPLISSLSYQNMMLTCSGLMLVDLLLLPVFGALAQKVGTQKMIYGALTCSLILSVPLFLNLNKPTVAYILWVRLILILWGLAIAAIFSHWSMTLVPQKDRFSVLALARALGAQWIGGPAISISLIIYKYTRSPASPAYYLVACSVLALILMRICHKKSTAAQTFKAPLLQRE